MSNQPLGTGNMNALKKILRKPLSLFTHKPPYKPPRKPKSTLREDITSYLRDAADCLTHMRQLMACMDSRDMRALKEKRQILKAMEATASDTRYMATVVEGFRRIIEDRNILQTTITPEALRELPTREGKAVVRSGTVYFEDLSPAKLCGIRGVGKKTLARIFDWQDKHTPKR